MAVAGLYKRVLPCPPAIEFASSDGKMLFAEALAEGTMNGFFRLISTFQTQAEPAYCGLSTLTVVLNALSIDPGRTWKGPWRWFDENMLDCCEPLINVKKYGITFAKVTCLAQCAGASVQAFGAHESSLDSFRSQVEKCLCSDDHHLIVSYDRRSLKQTGSGHFSPLGGYHRQKDMALILDVARFKYPPHWVPLSLLWEAINTIDEATGKSRGFMVISKREIPACFLFTLSCKDERWRAMCKYLLDDIPELVKSKNFTSTGQVIHTIFDSLPADVSSFVKWIVEVKLAENGETEKLDRDETERLQYKSKVLHQLRQTTAFGLITNWMEENCVKTSENDSLQNLIMHVCCQGAAAFTGIECLPRIGCIKKGGAAEVKMNGDGGDTLVLSNNVLVGECEQVIKALVPKVSSSGTVQGPCCQGSLEGDSFHPTARDLLSIVLLSLPASTWEDIPNEELRLEVCHSFAKEGLPRELRLEVGHLWEQATLVSRSCREDA